MAATGLQSPPSFWFFRRIAALMLREMASQYGRSVGGYVWAILEPLGMLILLAFGTSLLARNPALGNSFILFYATGYLPFFTFRNLTQVITTGLSYSRNLLRFPTVGWMDALLARALLQGITCLFLTCLILGGLLSCLDERIIFDPGPAVAAFALSLLLGVGVGVFNCAVGGLWSIWTQIWKILSRPLMLTSGIIWIMSDLPSQIQDILYFNPLMHITALARQGFYPMYAPDFVSVLYVCGFALIFLAFGLLLMRRFHGHILGRL